MTCVLIFTSGGAEHEDRDQYYVVSAVGWLFSFYMQYVARRDDAGNHAGIRLLTVSRLSKFKNQFESPLPVLIWRNGEEEKYHKIKTLITAPPAGLLFPFYHVQMCSR